MHKAINFLKNNSNINNSNNIVFLDIDGVLQPINNQYRFKYDMDLTIDYLAKKYNNLIYKQIDKYDICAAYYDWDNVSIGYLKQLLFETKAYIVIHSGWRETLDLTQIKALFKLYDLDEYILDICEPSLNKIDAINKYLENNKDNINEYVILDDLDMTNNFGYHFVLTKDKLIESNYYLAKTILQDNYKMWLKNTTLVINVNNQDILQLEIDTITINDYNIAKITYFEIFKYIKTIDYLIATNELIKILSEKEYLAFGTINYFKNSKFKILENICYVDKFSIYDFYYYSIPKNNFKAIHFYQKNKYLIYNKFESI